MNAEQIWIEVGLLGLPFLGWLVVVGPLMFAATLRAGKEGRQLGGVGCIPLVENPHQGRQDRLYLLKFFSCTFVSWGLTASMFLAARLIGHLLAGV